MQEKNEKNIIRTEKNLAGYGIIYILSVTALISYCGCHLC